MKAVFSLLAGWLGRVWGIPWAKALTCLIAAIIGLYGAFLGLRGWADRQKAALVTANAQLVRENAALKSQGDFYKAQNLRITADYKALKLAYENQATHRDFDCDGVATIEDLPDGRTLIRCEGKAHDATTQGPVLPPPIQPPTQATPSPCPDVVTPAVTADRPWRLGATAGLYDWKHPVLAGSLGYDWKRVWALAQVGPKLGTATIGVRF